MLYINYFKLLVELTQYLKCMSATYCPIYVQFTAPFTPGVYQSFWTMQNPGGGLFGNRIWAGIEVPGPATPTPAPTQTPSPNINFTVDRAQITVGECVTFNWNVTNAKATYFYQQGQSWQNWRG